MTDNRPDERLTRAQVAELLGCSLRKVDGLADENDPRWKGSPPLRKRRRLPGDRDVFIWRSDVEALLSQQDRDGTRDPG